MVKRLSIGLMVVLLAQTSLNLFGQTIFEIQPTVTYVTSGTFDPAPGPGDIVKIMAPRTERLKFVGLEGSEANPIVFINSGGQVNIKTTEWGALEFLDCKHIKVTGSGDSNYRYGFTLFGSDCGLAFSGFSSDCEAEFIEIMGDDETFFGIYAKKDFSGNPPFPYPQFNNLIIHDTYIHDVSEGMYIGETVSPGMEFRHVKIYNNIVTDTYRESIQIANCVEDVDIYNNLMVNSGLHGLAWQQNILQIGGNSVARVYNNIIKDGPDFGIQILGMGNIEILNNYIQNNKGIFIDDRYWTIDNSPINVENNYFLEQTSWEVVKNMNQYNNLYLIGNQYDATNNFFYNASGVPPILIVEDNIQTSLPELSFTIENGLFVPDAGNSEFYSSLGPVYNPDPVVERIILSSDMVSDLVDGGSIKSPKKLVDEQDLDPDLDEHPIGKQWKPAKNNNEAPFVVEINLGTRFYLDRILLHDYTRRGKITVSYEEDGNWIEIASDLLNQKYVWNEHTMGIQASKIRLTMHDWKAWVNEIALYGYPLDPGMKSEDKNEQVILSNPRGVEASVNIFPNPAADIVNFQSSVSISRTEIIDYQGRILISTEQNQISISEIPRGIYIVRMFQKDSNKTYTKRLIISH